MKRRIFSPLLLATVLLTGCTTTIAFRNLNQDKSPYPGLKEKRVALVVEASRVPEKVSTTSEFETFEFTDIASSVEGALKQQLTAATKSVEVFKTQPEGPFDYYIKPQVTVRSVYDFWTYGCLMTYKLEIYDKNQKLFASGSGEAKRNFMFTSQAEGKCSPAMAELFDSVNEKTLAKVAR